MNREILNFQANEKLVLNPSHAVAYFKEKARAKISNVFLYSEWNFTESYHGKGINDRVGAAVKRHVWKKVI